MKGVIFDVEGKFAHFRKIYTNSSSLSYSVPPRTTVQGMIAAMFGLPRDSYYEQWSSRYLHIAVKKNSRTYSMTQTVNYIKAVSTGELNQPKEHTQIPFEIIAGIDRVSYRIYVAFEEEAKTLELSKRVRKEMFAYPPTLGTAFFLADVTYVADVDFIEKAALEFVPVSTVIQTDKVQELKVEEFTLLREKMPRDFECDRTLLPACSYFVEGSGLPLQVKLHSHSSCWLVQYNQQQEYITFM
ncbi:hypothetical protein P22_4015 [Propionispora sp. 2/2-37]|uniref:type I-B CRISPR-associated protein Cas5b n=1 Tax=Propionispora sp. 2/2-37 TaxID=1677858 RepID=UPI0006BB5FF5|nr:type I-B CRISPR-associated protein Cas5b [Propionispora sp. 2/2-37]CUH97867.1 hypothetical protein P22_4015 [Propionispora sp. 2/2-37]